MLVVATGGAAAGPLGCFAVGALKGAVVGAAIGSATGAVTGAVGHRIKTGSWEGAGEAALNSAADGYMMGSITGFISGGMTSNQCFVAGTAILTSVGYVAIENIRAGDMVWATDPETGETELRPVVQTFRNETTELVHVTVNGEKIICTKEHPFYSPVKGWTAACQLRAGDILVLVNGEYVVVEQVQHELLESPVATYNFEVRDFHTYYVGEQSVLVHNLCVKQANTSGNGQVHHPFSKKIVDAANQNPNLKGVVTRESGTLRALNTSAHQGYQTWHRNFDKAVVSWLGKNQNATVTQFTGFMNKLYSSPQAISRFGRVLFV